MSKFIIVLFYISFSNLINPINIEIAAIIANTRLIIESMFPYEMITEKSITDITASKTKNIPPYNIHFKPLDSLSLKNIYLAIANETNIIKITSNK